MARRYVRRTGWTLQDYEKELLERSIEDNTAQTQRPELGLERPCRLWTGKVGHNGYASHNVLGLFLAHRVSHFVWNTKGEEFDCEVIMHRCDVRHCIEPTHLVEGTMVENMQDASAKGRLKPNESTKWLLARRARAAWDRKRKTVEPPLGPSPEDDSTV